MFYCIIARGRIGTLATSKTELPVTISNCLLPINIITNTTIPDATDNLNPSLVITMQNGPNHYTVGLKSTYGKSFSGKAICMHY